MLALLTTFALFVGTLGANTGKPVVAGYYPGYQTTLTPANVPYSTYTHLEYFVFTTQANGGLSTAGVADSVINQFVAGATAAGTSVSFTIGGYTGSQYAPSEYPSCLVQVFELTGVLCRYFSSLVSTSRMRGVFIANIKATMVKYGFNGVSIDWEYPGGGGEDDNISNPNDAANLLIFLQQLRTQLPSAQLSMSVQITGIRGADGNNLSDLSQYAAALDYITIMNYDIFGDYTPTTGPNDPTQTCIGYQPFSAQTGINYYVGAGVPASKILLGFPAYAYAYTVTPPLVSMACTAPGSSGSSFMYQPSVNSDGTCGNYKGAAPTSTYNYNQIAAMLSSYPAPTFDSQSGEYYIYNANTQVFIPYDPPASATLKAQYAKAQGLAGISMFSIDGDTTDHQLSSALQAVLNPATTTGSGRKPTAVSTRKPVAVGKRHFGLGFLSGKH